MRRFLIALAAGLCLTGPALAESPDRLITVTGEGRAEAVPDMATVSLGVTSEARTAAEALARNSAAMTQVLGQIAAAGIAPRDVQTSGLSLSPRWDNARSTGGPPRIVGYVVSNRVSVRVRELDGLGGLLDRLTSEGANSFGGVSFGLSEPGPIEDAARQAAVADARRKAELFAKAAGVTLGPLLSLQEAGGVSPPMPMERMEMAMTADIAVPVAAGEVSLLAQVTLVYAIAD
jgi:uncharacterized protein YggE